MSAAQENELDLDKLFLPAWAQESPEVNRFANYRGGETAGGRERGGRERGRDRGPRQPGFGRGPGARPDRGGPRGSRTEYARPERKPLPEPAPLPQVEVNIVPEEKVADSLARQIKMTGRAYPLFEIGHMVLQKPDRYVIRFDAIKKEGAVVQPLFVCALDDTLWLSVDDAVTYALEKHFATFYQSEKTPTDPPKGTYTFVAQCGMSGAILGPPNYHDYQHKLRKLHQERFSRMPFEMFKARVKIVRDEAVVKKWIEDQSFRTEYVCLNVPEAQRLMSREDVEKHFRAVHLPTIVQEVASHVLSGTASRQIPSHPLRRLAYTVLEEQKRFPIKVVHTLSQQFAGHGLQFFKVKKTITHVAVARPHFLDMEATPVSDGIRRIVEFINAHPKCTRRQLIEGLAPTPAPVPKPEGADAKPPSEIEPTPEQGALIADLHWLLHQGHVIEFANGLIETAKKPLPKPVKPAPKPVEEKTAEPVEQPGAAPTTAEPVAEQPKPEPASTESDSPPPESTPPSEPQRSEVTGPAIQ